MAIKKSELYSSLWQSCDELRGGMDASQYKDYVLVLLFIKYVSDKYAGQPYAPITIPPGAGFKDMVALKGTSTIGDDINKKIIAPLATANKLSDFPDFNDATKLGTGKEMVDRLTNLVAIFENPALDFSKNRAEGDDMSPLAPERERVTAGRLFLAEIERHIRARHDFGVETTLAGRGYLRLIRRLKATGWRVELIYLALPDVEMAKLRVAERVRDGGHDIQTPDIERRFIRSLRNLFGVYAVEVDRTLCYLNTRETPDLVFRQYGQQREVLQPMVMQSLQAWRLT